MIKLNKDNPDLDNILQRIKDNAGYCPCAIIRNEDTKCNCKEFREMSEGVCHCGAFVKLGD